MLRKLSITKELKWLFASIFIAFACGALLYLFASNYSESIIKLFYHRGAFTVADIFHTASYFKQMSLAICILLISSVLSQPYFTLDMGVRNQYSRYLSSIILVFFILILVILYFNDWDARYRSLVMLYAMSIISLLISIFTCIKYFKHES